MRKLKAMTRMEAAANADNGAFSTGENNISDE